jgi:hypothetical protein
VFFASVIAFALAGCGTIVPSPVPSASQPTISLSPYIHYAPSEITNVYLEFDYPKHWFFSEEIIHGTENISIGLGDPRLLNVPTRAPNESHGTPSDFGRINIWIQPTKSDQPLGNLVKPHKQGYDSASWITLTNEYKIMVDGNDAVVFEYQVELIDYNGFTALMFERNIFLLQRINYTKSLFWSRRRSVAVSSSRDMSISLRVSELPHKS